MKKFSDLFLMLIILAGILFLSFSEKQTGSEILLNNSKTDSIFLNDLSDSILRSGDLIFRDGRGIISNSFKKLSLKDPRYSHAGLIHIENGEIYVYHIIGSEGKQNCRMKKESLIDFCSSMQANAIGIYRSNLNGNKIDSLAGYYYDKKTEFDYQFNIETDDRFYCTELLYKILIKISGKDNFLSLTNLTGVKYESCDDIYLSPHVKEIYSFVYPH